MRDKYNNIKLKILTTRNDTTIAGLSVISKFIIDIGIAKIL